MTISFHLQIPAEFRIQLHVDSREVSDCFGGWNRYEGGLSCSSIVCGLDVDTFDQQP